jgi:hypothetical protein
MGPYLIHPDKLQAVHNILLKQKARKPKPKPKAPAAPSGNIVLKLLQQAYAKRQQTTGRSY